MAGPQNPGDQIATYLRFMAPNVALNEHGISGSVIARLLCPSDATYGATYLR